MAIKLLTPTELLIVVPSKFYLTICNIVQNCLHFEFDHRTKQQREGNSAGKSVKHAVQKEMQKMLLMRISVRGRGRIDVKKEMEVEEVCASHSFPPKYMYSCTL